MLARILTTIRDAGRPMCLADLSRALDVDEPALEGMLDMLIARDRLRAIEFADQGCGGCPIRSGCFIMNDGIAKTYALAPAPVAPASGSPPTSAGNPSASNPSASNPPASSPPTSASSPPTSASPPSATVS